MYPNTQTNLFKERLVQANRVLDAYDSPGSFPRSLTGWSIDKDVWYRNFYMANEADRIERYCFTVYFRPKTSLVDRISCDSVA